MLDILKSPIVTFQEFILLAGRATTNIVRRPFYGSDVILQMDTIGVGSLPITILIGFFSGAVMALQMSRALSQYGATGQVGQNYGDNAGPRDGAGVDGAAGGGAECVGMASELGSMKVTEQIDAMRALGTDPIKKLVTPRLIATCFTLPLLTIVADFIGIIGGYIIAVPMLALTTSTQYWNNAWRSLEYNDITQGLLKPLVFAEIISLVGCLYGMRTTGGTQGVGRATTQAVVVATVWIFVCTFLITRIFVNI